MQNRLKTFVGGRYSQWNLSSLIYAGKRDDIEVVCWDAPGRSKPTFDEAKNEIDAGHAKKIEIGHKFGPSWVC
jgi:alpha-mannosidase